MCAEVVTGLLTRVLALIGDVALPPFAALPLPLAFFDISRADLCCEISSVQRRRRLYYTVDEDLDEIRPA